MKGNEKTLKFNEERGSYSIINNETGLSKPTYFNSLPLKKYSNSITGIASFKERETAAIEMPELMPTTTSLRKKVKNYIPCIDKIEGYAQFPSGIVPPYFNQKGKLKGAVIPKNLDKLTFLDERNVNASKGNLSMIPQYFTATISDTKRAKSLGISSVMNYRKSLQKQPFDGLNVKLINGSTRKSPQNLPLNFSKVKFLKASVSKKLEARRMIHEGRYETKVFSKENWTMPLTSETGIDSLALYMENENFLPIHSESMNLKSLTFEKNEFQPKSSRLQHKQIDSFLLKLKRDNEELEGFHVLKEEIKDRVFTKGRFNSKIPSR